MAIAIPESRLAELKAGAPLAVRLWAQPDLQLRGELRELAAAADPATRTYAARIRIVDPPPAAQLGMTARVIVGGTGEATIVVPLTAVVDTGKGPQVWVVSAGKATLRDVAVAKYREDVALIAHGLQAGEPVILTGQRILSPGLAVDMQTAPTLAQQR